MPTDKLRCESHLTRLVTLLTLLLFAVISFPPAVLAQKAPRSPKDLQKQIRAILDDPAYENAGWAILIKDMKSDKTLFERNAKKSYIPASNVKLYTTSAALTLLGPEFRYETKVYSDAPVVNGVLSGNLIVKGSGDPVIGGRFNDGDITETFRTWADTLKSMGIRRIEGDIIGDDDLFDDLELGYGWSWDDVPFWYSAEISALSLNDANIDFEIAAGEEGGSARITWEPAMTGYASVLNATFTLPSSSSLEEGYSREWDSNRFRIYSQVPAGSIDRESLSVRNPTLFFVHVLRETLIKEGIAVLGKTVDIDDISVKPDYTSESTWQVTTHFSPPLKDIVYVLNKRSQNLYAEQLLKTLAARLPVDDDELVPGSAQMGLAREMEVFASAGVDTSRINIVDGSGLSRMNLITAEMTSSILRYMRYEVDDSTRAAFFRSLPVGGIDGTLEYRFKKGPARGKVHAKTGTVSHASSLSGYIASALGTPLSFVIMCTHFTGPTSQVRQTQDRIIELLAKYTR
jgi:serine-type D-Ala-D-Ala carboxypeptidase/endopeptidase (penicillin-binding protein 4)